MVVAVGLLGIAVLVAVDIPVATSLAGSVTWPIASVVAVGVDIPSPAWQAMSVVTDMIMQSVLWAFVL